LGPSTSMKKLYTPWILIAVGIVAGVVLVGEVGCSNQDHVPTHDEIVKSHETRLKALENVNLPEVQKRTIEAQMGGRPYQNPAIAEAMAKARAHGAQIGGR